MKTRKQFLALVLALLVLLGTAACAPDPSSTAGTTTSPTPTQPATDPTDPTEPINPTEPTEPTKPTEPTDPTDPMQPYIIVTGAKTEFAFGEEFSAQGLTVTLKQPDGSDRKLADTDYTVTCGDFSSMKPGTYQVTVQVKDMDISADYNITVSPANRLKVLMIGNSYADDTINYAYEIAKSVGIPAENILVADIYIGGCSLATHWENAQSNAAAYRFGLEKEGWFDGESYKNWTMEQAIKYADWDFITFQQNSGNSGGAASYACLQNLMDYVYGIATDEENNPNANPNVKFVWHQTWAYQQGTTASAFATYGYDQMTMYNAIMDCLNTQVMGKNFVAVIPNGTAIQNGRTSILGDNFSRDQHNHLSYGAGRYIASMNLVSVLTGRDMSTLTWKPTDSGFNCPLTQEEILACKESVANAIANPFEITQSKYPYIPIPENLSDIFEGQGTEQDPYLIQTADDLWMLSHYTRGKSFTNTDTYFKLTADIDLSAQNWQPICASADTGWVADANSFNAHFDGNGKTITFVGTYTGDTWAKGLFSAVGGHVHDLTLRGTITTEKGRVGSLASMAVTGARIENVTSYVDISAGNNQVGGIIGYIASPDVTITNCVNYGTVHGRELVGGIVGGSWQNVTYIGCVNHGAITATLKSAGGIAGEKFPQATLTNCSNDGAVTAGGTPATADTGSANNHAGYLVGYLSQ